MSLFADKYHGTDLRADNGDVWASAEQGLRIVAREQRVEIARLNADVERLQRELARAKWVVAKLRARPKLKVVKERERKVV